MQQTKVQDQTDGFTGEFCQIFKELIAIFLKIFQKTEEGGMIPNLFFKASITLTQKPDKETAKGNCRQI